MHKRILQISIIILLALLSVKVANAYFMNSGSFGGKIVNTKASEVQSAEGAGYTCTIPGRTIEVKTTTKGSVGYFIPFSTRSSTNTIPSNGQSILGLSRFKSAITCEKPEKPPKIKVISLDTVTLYGTSKH